jgi:hypothetical protein
MKETRTIRYFLPENGETAESAWTLTYEPMLGMDMWHEAAE